MKWTVAMTLILVLNAPLSVAAQKVKRYPAWISVTAGGGRDEGAQYYTPRPFAVLRGAVGVGGRWGGIQSSLAVLDEWGVLHGEFTVDGVVRLRPRRPKTRGIVPYLLAGGGVFFSGSGESEPKIHIGGGIDHYFRRHLGLRAEIRDSLPFEGGAHHLDYTVGMLWHF